MNLSSHPNDLIAYLLQHDIQSAYFLFRNGELKTSHPELSDLANEISAMVDFKNHEGIFLEVDAKTESLHTAFIYNTVRGQAAGGVRFLSYDSIESLIKDGLRLSKGMADKNAVARLWWGGGKGVIYRNKAYGVSDELRHDVFTKYGLFISKLNGVYVTAEDMNTRPADMATIFSATRHTSCIPVINGGSSNPSIFTAKGVFSGIKAAAEFKYGGNDALKNKVALVQGAGNVGFHVIEQFVEAGTKVFVYEPQSKTIEKIKNQFSDEQVTVVENGDALMAMEGHFLSCNAIGGTLNDDSISNLKVDIVAGGANNQLRDPEKHSAALHEKGIIYLPDFFINRLGIINCANEQYGYVEADIWKEVELVYSDSLDLLKAAADKNCSPQVIANDIATQRMQEAHPIWGHRGPALVDEMIKKGFGNPAQKREPEFSA